MFKPSKRHDNSNSFQDVHLKGGGGGGVKGGGGGGGHKMLCLALVWLKHYDSLSRKVLSPD